MAPIKRLLAALIFPVLFTVFSASSTVAETSIPAEPAGVSDAAVLFLRIVNSPRANGMGGCVANMVNEQSPLYNPGAAGLFHLANYFAVTSPIYKTKWLPKLTDDARVKSFTVSGGLPLRKIGLQTNEKLNLAVALSYSRLQLDYGMFGSIDKADYFTLAMGVEYYVRAGIGYTYKKIRSTLSYQYTGKASAHDIGMILELPIEATLLRCAGRDHGRDIGVVISPSVAYVRANIGDEIAYIDAAQADPIPETSKIGFALYGAIKKGEASIVSVLLTRETEKDLVGDKCKVQRYGTEIGLLGTLFLRSGRFEDDPAECGQRDVETYGVGFSTGGALSWLLAISQSQKEDELLRYLISRFDLTLDFARYRPDDSQFLSSTSFLKLSMSF